MTGQKSLTSAAAAHRSNALGVFLAMLALAIQCLVVQPHVDGLTGAPALDFVHVTATQSTHDDGGPAVCFICQAIAFAGALTLASAPTLGIVERNIVFAAPAEPFALLQRPRSHSWQSRGPPPSV